MVTMLGTISKKERKEMDKLLRARRKAEWKWVKTHFAEVDAMLVAMEAYYRANGEI